MRFEKWHALGNAYVLVQQPDAGAMVRVRLPRREVRRFAPYLVAGVEAEPVQ